jgi:hypothetical protein
MRKLKLVVGRAPGALSVLVTAGLVSCGSKSGLPDFEVTDAGTTGGGSGGIVSGGGSGGIVSGGGFGGIPIGGFGGGLGGSGGNELCPPFAQLQTYEVELPPPGTMATPGQICAVASEPVVSNTAARVQLMKFSPMVELASGTIVVAPGLEAAIVSVPTVKVVQSNISVLQQMTVTNLLPVPGGFTFDASWPPPLNLEPDGFATMRVEVSFEIACASTGDTRTVTSVTNVHLCLTDSQNDVEWVSSGDECTVCEIIAEMAPSPIVPDKSIDDLPLAQALRLRLLELARVGKSRVLFAENDGGEDTTYEWHPSGGTLEELAPDIVLWTPDDEVAFLQAAVSTRHGMAVASYAASREVS